MSTRMARTVPLALLAAVLLAAGAAPSTASARSTYCSPTGDVDDAHNVNGSTGSIAGVRNETGNVVGLMPHPEHAVDPDVGATGGQPMFAALLHSALERVGAA